MVKHLSTAHAMQHVFDVIERDDFTEFQHLVDAGELTDAVWRLCTSVHLRALKKPMVWQHTILPFGLESILQDKKVQKTCIYNLITLHNSYLMQDLQAAIDMGFYDVAQDVGSFVFFYTSDRLTHKTAQCYNETFMKFLILELGVDATIENDLGKTMLEYTNKWPADKMYNFYVNDLNLSKAFVFERMCCMSDKTYVLYMMDKINSKDVTPLAVYHAAKHRYVEVVCAYINSDVVAYYHKKENRNILFYMLKFYDVRYNLYIVGYRDIVVDRQLKWYPMHAAAYYCNSRVWDLTFHKSVEKKCDAYGRDVFMIAVHGLVDYRINISDKDWAILDHLMISLHKYDILEQRQLSSVVNGRKQHLACGLDVMLAALLRFAHVVAPMDNNPQRPLYVTNGLLFAYKLFPELSMESITYRKLFISEASKLMVVKKQLYNAVISVLNRRVYRNNDVGCFFNPDSTIYQLLKVHKVDTLKRLSANAVFVNAIK